MSDFTLSNKEISSLVSRELSRRGWSIRRCVEHYNRSRKINHEYMVTPELNKDFLLRIKNNNFEVANERVAKLCKFLGIDVSPQMPQSSFLELRHEFDRVEALLDLSPNLKNQLSDILNSIADLAIGTRGASK